MVEVPKVRILYHSAAPWVSTGYGRCTREIAPRLHNENHEVAIQCMSSVRKDGITWHGDELKYELEEPMKVYPANSPFGLGEVTDAYDDFDADFYFTHFDTWMERARKSIPEFEVPYASYVIVDHYPAPQAVIDQIQNSHETVVMSKWAKEVLAEKGVRSRYIPHGVHLDQYFPLNEQAVDDMNVQVQAVDGGTKEIRVGDVTIIGMVAANHGDRKNIPAHMEAFNMYLNNVDEDAIMYVHTDPNPREGYNLNEVRKEIGLPIENIIWSRPGDYHDVGDEYLNRLYNAFDVLVNCSFGESWGLTITESMAAGTPVICSNFSSMPEQIGIEPRNGDVEKTVFKNVLEGPHGVAVEPSIGLFREKVSSKQYICSAEDIYKAIKWYTEKPDLIEEHGEKAREHVKENYSWERNVVPEFNKMFRAIEAVV